MHPPVSLTKRYSFVGPGTKLNKRLDSNKNPLPHSKPVNKLDEIAMKNDICYEKYPDTKERNKICDKKMLDVIKSNKKTSSINEWIMRRGAKNLIGSKKGYWNIDILTLFKMSKIKKLILTTDLANELHKPVIKKSLRKEKLLLMGLMIFGLQILLTILNSQNKINISNTF